jgi:hypothetical protein
MTAEQAKHLLMLATPPNPLDRPYQEKDMLTRGEGEFK